MASKLTIQQIHEREPAFSRQATMINEVIEYAEPGLTKLEYAAIHIAGSIAHASRTRDDDAIPYFDEDEIADAAVRIARAVLARTQE